MKPYPISTRGNRWRPLGRLCRVCGQAFQLGQWVFPRVRHIQSDSVGRGDKRYYYHVRCARRVHML